MKYMIHSCQKRLWYVENFMIPDMVSKGINKNDIILWNDSTGIGNLKMFIKSMEFIKQFMPINQPIWHLQDDVMLSSDFKSVTENCPSNIVCNRFCAFEKKNFGYIGRQTSEHRWLSFQAIQIPNKHAVEFLQWWNDVILKRNREIRRRSENKHDDHFFWKFMDEVHPNDTILNITPNIVQHISYMMGGSTLGNDYPERIEVSQYWMDEEQEKQLLQEIKRFIANNKTG